MQFPKAIVTNGIRICGKTLSSKITILLERVVLCIILPANKLVIATLIDSRLIHAWSLNKKEV
jgi:hypothetical protein